MRRLRHRLPRANAGHNGTTVMHPLVPIILFMGLGGAMLWLGLRDKARAGRRADGSCGNCGHRNQPQARYCAMCGQRL